MKMPKVREILYMSSWDDLNEILMRENTTLQDCYVLLRAELTGLRRPSYAVRIQRRINKLRGEVELRVLRQELRRTATK